MAKQIQQNLGGIGFSRRPGLHTGRVLVLLFSSSCGIHQPQVPKHHPSLPSDPEKPLAVDLPSLAHVGQFHTTIRRAPTCVPSCFMPFIKSAPANQISRTSAPIENLQGLEIDFENDRFCSSCQVLSLSLLGILTRVHVLHSSHLQFIELNSLL